MIYSSSLLRDVSVGELFCCPVRSFSYSSSSNSPTTSQRQLRWIVTWKRISLSLQSKPCVVRLASFPQVSPSMQSQPLQYPSSYVVHITIRPKIWKLPSKPLRNPAQHPTYRDLYMSSLTGVLLVSSNPNPENKPFRRCDVIRYIHNLLAFTKERNCCPIPRLRP